jgi:hypothetical protein
MANRQINTRIKMKYATYEEWMASDLVLLEGEMALCYISEENDEIKNVPAVLAKIGDGEKTFSQLGWTKAPAADVYEWAKQEHAPAGLNATMDEDEEMLVFSQDSVPGGENVSEVINDLLDEEY